MLQVSTETISSQTVTDQKLIDKLHNFNITYGKHNEISFCLLMQKEDGTTKFYERKDQPCWGELRSYNYKADGYSKPSDLHHPFPKGTPIGLACVNFCSNPLWNQYFEWLFSEASPWGKCLNNPIITYRDDIPVGVVFTNTKFDPTVMAQALLLSKNVSHISDWNKYTSDNIHPLVAFLLCQQFPGRTTTAYGDSYSFALKIDPWRLWNARPHNLTPHKKSFYDRGNYNRPRVHSIFTGSVHLPGLVRPLFYSSFTLKDAVDTVAPLIYNVLSTTPEDPKNIKVYEGPQDETDGDEEEDLD